MDHEAEQDIVEGEAGVNLEAAQDLESLTHPTMKEPRFSSRLAESQAFAPASIIAAGSEVLYASIVLYLAGDVGNGMAASICTTVGLLYNHAWPSSAYRGLLEG